MRSARKSLHYFFYNKKNRSFFLLRVALCMCLYFLLISKLVVMVILLCFHISDSINSEHVLITCQYPQDSLQSSSSIQRPRSDQATDSTAIILCYICLPTVVAVRLGSWANGCTNGP